MTNDIILTLSTEDKYRNKQEHLYTTNWQPIETALKDKVMVAIIGVTSGNVFTGGRPYTTDPYCGWFQDGKWQRWPHNWNPTHWMPLPKPPVT